MPDKKTITIFLASSAELKEERDAFRLFIAGLNDKFIYGDTRLKILHWENFLDAISETGLQSEYNAALEKADIALCLFFTKVGQYTEEEFDTAYKTFKASGKPKIWTYFKNAPVYMEAIGESEINSLFQFKKKLKGYGHYYSVYDNTADLHNKFRSQLDEILPKLILPAVTGIHQQVLQNTGTLSAKSLQKGVDTIAFLMDETSEANIKAAINQFIELAGNTPMKDLALTLKEDWIEYKENRPPGLSKEDWLKNFSKRFNEAFKTFTDAVIPRHAAYSQDNIYNLLCKLNFSHQTIYFQSLMNSDKKFVSFVIRGPQANYGQRWLANKLIQVMRNQQEPLHDPLGLDFLQLNLKLDSFLEHLAKAVGITYQQNMSMDARRIKLKNELVKRIETATQFIILINSFSFIHSEEYKEFIKMIKYFSEEINNAGLPYKCIFLFVEEQTSDRYAHIEDCIFSEEKGHWLAKLVQEFRFVDLGTTKPIVTGDITDWFAHCSPDQFNCFTALAEEECEMLKFLGDGNPQQVIALICEKIGVNYIENEKLWLKY